MEIIHPLSNTLGAKIYPFENKAKDYHRIMDDIGDARFVLLGEASHGTHEFYQVRAELTKHLIQERGFNAIAIEGDWPDAHQVHRYVNSHVDVETTEHALSQFKRFPTWMWRNQDVISFIAWLKDYNQKVEKKEDKVGFHGLDLYSLHASMEAVIDTLEKIDPHMADAAKTRYNCLQHYAHDPESYAYAAKFNLGKDCKREVREQLLEIKDKLVKNFNGKAVVGAEEVLSILQNATVVKNAEEYYRTLFFSEEFSSWNIRDHHMAETLDLVSDYYEKLRAEPSKIVVWAHNSHVGDARATEMGQRDEFNIGQLARERYGNAVYLLGFSTYSGTVTAASNWKEMAKRKHVIPALPNSYEHMFHQMEQPNLLLFFSSKNKQAEPVDRLHLQRAIGVIYRPETERASHYQYVNLPRQFDALIHLDPTSAVRPLDLTETWEVGELPETYPSGI